MLGFVYCAATICRVHRWNMVELDDVVGGGGEGRFWGVIQVRPDLAAEESLCSKAFFPNGLEKEPKKLLTCKCAFTNLCPCQNHA
jgi:hypothetical protein